MENAGRPKNELNVGAEAMGDKLRSGLFVLGLALGALLVCGVGSGLALLGYLRIHVEGPWFISVALTIALDLLRLSIR